MRISLMPLLVTLFSFQTTAQVTYTEANLSRFSKQSGSFILWYGEGGTKATQYAAFSVTFDDSYTEQSVVSDLKKKVYNGKKYITYEFKKNFGCNEVYNYIMHSTGLKLKDVKDLRFGNCSDMNYKYLQTAPEITYNKQVFALVKPSMEDREKALVAEGWKKVYEDYDTGTIASQHVVKPGYAYTGLGAVYTNGDTSLTGQVLITDENEVIGGFEKYIEHDRVLLETDDFQPAAGLKDIYFSVGSNPSARIKSGMAVFEKPIDFKRDFYRLLEARNDGFKAIKSNLRNKNQEGYDVYNSTIGLGYHKAKINETNEVIEYVLEMDMLHPNTMKFLNNLVPELQELPAKGYKAEDYKSESGGDVTEITRDGEEVMLIASYPAKNIIYFYIYKKKKK